MTQDGVWEYLGRFSNRLWYTDSIGVQEEKVPLLSYGSYFSVYCRTRLIRINWATSHPDMQKFQIIEFFFENGPHWQFEVEKNCTNGSLRLHIYLLTNTTLIHNSLCVFDSWGENLSHKKVQYSYSKKMFTRRAKPFRIIGDPDNQRPDKWSSTVLHFSLRLSTLFFPSVCICHSLFFSYISFHGQVC